MSRIKRYLEWLGGGITDFLLYFKDKKYERTTDGLWEFQVVYKMLFGRKYILEINPLPPCRCKGKE
jgi:hypothetical protein